MSLSTRFYRILYLSTFNFYIDLYHVVVEHFLTSVFIFGSVPKLIHLSYDSFILYESILFYISGGEEKLSLFIDISQNLISEKPDPSKMSFRNRSFTKMSFRNRPFTDYPACDLPTWQYIISQRVILQKNSYLLAIIYHKFYHSPQCKQVLFASIFWCQCWLVSEWWLDFLWNLLPHFLTTWVLSICLLYDSSLY